MVFENTKKIQSQYCIVSSFWWKSKFCYWKHSLPVRKILAKEAQIHKQLKSMICHSPLRFVHKIGLYDIISFYFSPSQLCTGIIPTKTTYQVDCDGSWFFKNLPHLKVISWDLKWNYIFFKHSTSRSASNSKLDKNASRWVVNTFINIFCHIKIFCTDFIFEGSLSTSLEIYKEHYADIH